MSKIKCYCNLTRQFKKPTEFMLVLCSVALDRARAEPGEREGASDAFATSVRPPPPARERAAADGDGSSTSSRMAWKLVEPAPSYKRKSCVRPSVPPRSNSESPSADVAAASLLSPPTIAASAAADVT